MEGGQIKRPDPLPLESSYTESHISKHRVAGNADTERPSDRGVLATLPIRTTTPGPAMPNAYQSLLMILRAALLALVFTYSLTAFGQNDRSPRVDCTNCSAPNGGTYQDHSGAPWCPDCFNKEFGRGVWNNAAGAWVPRVGAGGGGGGSAGGCTNSCHGGGRNRRSVSSPQGNITSMPADTFHTLLAATQPTGRISPHAGKELELLLSGAKPMAMFSQDANLDRADVGDMAMRPYVENGRLIYRQITYPGTGVVRHYYAQPEEAWRIKAMHVLQKNYRRRHPFASFDRHDYYRMVGFLLGYEKADIDYFIEQTDNRLERLETP